ncbi:hypothetical protein FB45DRAFT_914964 [Roridomyces roridus]|uniref:Secreted protein n=1 Tax=Roridomyces roridus TaxID=1738132 RepID=A0AAD7BU62_9AGAR|nr:hypothetical protein FB45DRAFT_914964 [Roridomyces roridus]
MCVGRRLSCLPSSLTLAQCFIIPGCANAPYCTDYPCLPRLFYLPLQWCLAIHSAPLSFDFSPCVLWAKIPPARVGFLFLSLNSSSGCQCAVTSLLAPGYSDPSVPPCPFLPFGHQDTSFLTAPGRRWHLLLLASSFLQFFDIARAIGRPFLDTPVPCFL